MTFNGKPNVYKCFRFFFLRFFLFLLAFLVVKQGMHIFELYFWSSWHCDVPIFWFSFYRFSIKLFHLHSSTLIDSELSNVFNVQNVFALHLSLNWMNEWIYRMGVPRAGFIILLNLELGNDLLEFFLFSIKSYHWCAVISPSNRIDYQPIGAQNYVSYIHGTPGMFLHNFTIMYRGRTLAHTQNMYITV